MCRYALDEEMSAKLRKSNPEAFQNILKRMLEAKGRGYWDPDDEARPMDFMSSLRYTALHVVLTK